MKARRGYSADNMDRKCPFGFEYVLAFRKRDGTWIDSYCRKLPKKDLHSEILKVRSFRNPGPDNAAKRTFFIGVYRILGVFIKKGASTFFAVIFHSLTRIFPFFDSFFTTLHTSRYFHPAFSTIVETV